jgi:hypothetical protein
MQFDKKGWLDEAVKMPYLEKSMSRAGLAVSHVVLHGTAGGTRAEDIAKNIFQNPAYQSSTHFVIGKDGTIVQGVPCSLAAWGNGYLITPRLPFPPAINPNLYTVSIEHCKNQRDPTTGRLDNSDPLTDPQKLSSFRLVRALCEHYHIPKSRGDVHGGIVEHADFDMATRSHCPGPYPYDELWSFFSSGGDDTMNMTDPFFQAHFTDKGKGVYQCKDNGVTMLGAIAKYWLYCNGSPRLPLSGELYKLFPENDVVAQVCESAIIVYDPSHQIDNPDMRHSCYLLKASDPRYGPLMEQYGGLSPEKPTS